MPTESGTGSTLARFGIFEIDLETEELRRAGRPVAIQQHSFLVLRALVERAGEEVTRDEFRRRLWPDQEFLDFENGINTAVARLRQALGDSAESPRYIGTRRGHGYRLLAPVVWIDRAPSPPSRPSEPVAESAVVIPLSATDGRRLWPLMLAAALVLLASSLFLLKTRSAQSAARAATRAGGTDGSPLLVHAPSGENITGSFALSPSGRWLAFVTGGSMPDESHLCLRSLTDVNVHSFSGTTGATLPFWSPDERAVGFFADGHLKTIDIESGSVRTLVNAATGRGGTWNTNGTILFAPDLNSAILAVPMTGGPTRAVTDVTGESSHRFPFFLPDGQHFLYLALREDRDQSELRWGRLGGPDGGSLGESGSNAVYVQPGFLLLARKTALLAIPFDAATVQIRGSPTVVQEHLGVYGEEGPTGLAAFSASASGSLAVADLTRPALRFSWFDRRGTQLGLVGPAADYLGFDLFPDGSRAVAVQFDARKRWSDLLTLDLRSGVATDLTDDPWPDWSGPWSPDGRQIVFTSLRHGIWRAFVEDWPRTRPEREIARCNTVDSWFPDGRNIVCEVYTREGVDLIKVSLDQKDAPATIVSGLKTPTAEARVSPDGQWLAYVSQHAERGREVYVARLNGGASSPPLFIGAGNIPRWRRDGRELYFLYRRTLMSVAVNRDTSAAFASPARLFDAPLPPRDSLADNPVEFAVSGDGSQFLIPVASENEPPNAIRVLSRWSQPSLH